MKRLVALALAMAMVSLAGVAVAEEDDECGCCGEINMCEQTFEQGLEFGFSGLCNIGVSTVKQGSIGLKKAMGPNQMGIVRFGFGLGSDTQEAAADGFSDAKDGSRFLDLAVGMQMYKPCCGKCLLPYIGGLVKVDYSGTTDEPSVADDPADGTRLKTTTTGIGLDLIAFVGGEWFFTKCMSLSGEYNFGFGYERSSTKHEYENADDVESKSSGWDFGPFSTAAVRLTMYWK